MPCSTIPFRLGLLVILTGMLPGYASAATLSGSVADEGEAIGQVEIVLVNTANSVVLDKTRSMPDGSFSFSVEPGRFKVGAFKSDYTTVWLKGIDVDTDDVEIRIELEPKVFADPYAGTSDDDGC